jgi:hypothetical protein
MALGEHAILGWDFESEGVVVTAFQASESFLSNGKAVTKELRKAIPAIMQWHGIQVVCTYSLCIDPDAPKWFRLLGLIEDETYTGFKRGPHTLRRFIRR